MICSLIIAILVTASILAISIVALLANCIARYRAKARLSQVREEAQGRLARASDRYVGAVARTLTRRD